MTESDNLSFDMLPKRPNIPPKDSPINHDRLAQLRTIAGTGPVLILTHDNPDPDALASGKAFATLLKSAWNLPSRLS